MNRKIVFNITGKFLQSLSLLLLLPMIVSLIYKEHSFMAFLVTSIISFAAGFTITLFSSDCKKELYAREGFLIVALAWVSASLVGCLPFIISGEVTSFVDAFFETVSGFTTTGASVLNPEKLSHGILFWRSLTHWIGGMGVLVFIVAFAGNLSDRAIHILRAEMPGPVVGKIVPRAKDTSKVLYIMYIILTVAQIIFLWCGEMDLFESIVHSLGTAGTGGFGIKGDSLAGYSAYSQWVITAFMLIFGINFNLYYLLTIKRFKAVFKSVELWTYISMVIICSLLIAVNVRGLFPSFGETIRQSVFQVSSIITTTGYATADFNLWPQFSRSIIFVLLFTGACAGSTAGGLKLSRVIILFKMGIRETKRLVHPRSIGSVKFEGKDVDETTQNSIAKYFAVYMMCIFVIFILLSAGPETFGFETSFTAAVTCFNNVGPGFDLIGPMGSFNVFSDYSKILLSFCMLLGRLEIFPILIAIIPSTWKNYN